MATIFMLIAIALDMMFPKVSGKIVNEVLIGRDFQIFPYLLAAIVLIGVGRSVFGYFKEFTFDTVSVKKGEKKFIFVPAVK